MDEIIKYTEIIYKGKSYKGNEIELNVEVMDKLNRNMLNYPIPFLQKVKTENGIIKMIFHEDGSVEKRLTNVSNELLDEFHSKYF